MIYIKYAQFSTYLMTCSRITNSSQFTYLNLKLAFILEYEQYIIAHRLYNAARPEKTPAITEVSKLE